MIPHRAFHHDRLVDVLEQQFVRADEIELEILLQYTRARLAERHEGDGGGIDEPRDVSELQSRATAVELDVPLMPYEGVPGDTHAILNAGTGRWAIQVR